MRYAWAFLMRIVYANVEGLYTLWVFEKHMLSLSSHKIVFLLLGTNSKAHTVLTGLLFSGFNYCR